VKRYSFGFAGFLVICYSLGPAVGSFAEDNALSDKERSEGWLLLFDGSTTNGWMTRTGQPLPKTHVQNGSLNPHPCDYMLVHEKVWDNFQLALDLKISPKCNSGVFVRTFPLAPRSGKDVGFNGIEVAVDDTKTSGFHDTGAIYDLVKPAKNAMKPVGQWNHMVVTCDRNKIAVELNGEVVTHMDLDEWSEAYRRPDGSEHKFDVAYRNHPRKGYIGLQDHGSDCWYKNIKLRTLAADEPPQLLFTSQGKSARINVDGSGEKYFDFSVPNQATWQPGPIFPDRKRLIFLSMEPRRDGPGRPFEEYYTQTPTHLWVHDLTTGELKEICTNERRAVFVTPALLLGDGRMLVQVVRDKVGQIYNVRMDGSDAREFTRAGEGLPYGLSLSPDEKRVAFHLASPEGYQVWTSDVNGKQRQRIAADPNHLYFGTSWSRDGKSILYVDCHYHEDPGHDWADVCVGAADGSQHRVLTTGQPMWFAATYGNLETRGGGSNLPAWTHDGKILFPQRHPNSKVAWKYQPQRVDVDHFNRDYKPELSRGGTEICRLDPRDGSCEPLTRNKPGVWDFRAIESPDGRWIAFCRAATGEAPALWVMESDGSNPRQLTRGWQRHGADHPQWLLSR
jgi:3-keto-disaccharide hydrolase/WD40-like Beta Propeller Repeat